MKAALYGASVGCAFGLLPLTSWCSLWAHAQDFDTLIPGHGGVTDRFDCQFVMAVFTYVYYKSFVNVHNVQVVLANVFSLDLEHQQEVRRVRYALLFVSMSWVYGGGYGMWDVCEREGLQASCPESHLRDRLFMTTRKLSLNSYRFAVYTFPLSIGLRSPLPAPPESRRAPFMKTPCCFVS